METLTQEFYGAVFRGNKYVPVSREIVVIGSSGSASSYGLHCVVVSSSET